VQAVPIVQRALALLVPQAPAQFAQRAPAAELEGPVLVVFSTSLLD
jgi:hypothetical protein